MCGVSGVFSPDLSMPAKGLEQAVRIMVASLSHRGPDEWGVACRPDIALGHVRLAVRGGSSGCQPFEDKRTGCVLSYNGELYDETDWAKKAAESSGLSNKVLQVPEEDQARYFPQAVFHAERYVQLTDGVAKLLLARHAARDVKVVLVGEGADEVFLGYPSHLRAAAAEPGLQNLPMRISNHTTRPGLDYVIRDFDRIDGEFLSNQVRQTLLMAPFISGMLGDAVRDLVDVEALLDSYHDEGCFREGFRPYYAEQIAALRLTMPNYLFMGGKLRWLHPWKEDILFLT